MKTLPYLLVLALGFLLGWLVFGTGAAPPTVPPTAPEPGPRTVDCAAPPDLVSEPAPATIDPVETLRRGGLDRMWPLVNDHERTWTHAEVAALIERLDRARAAGYRNEFMAALRGLSMAKTGAAQKKLLQLMVDETLIPPSRLGRDMLRGLGDSDLPGIAAGARMRYEMNIASGKTSWVGGDGYFELIALRGSAEDIAWLAERAESGQLRYHARKALVKSKSPLAVQFVVRMLEEGKGDQDLLVDFARSHPTTAAPLLRRVLSGDLEVPYRETSAIFRAYGSSVPEDALDGTREFLSSFAKPLKVICAVYAVEQLTRRGLDITGFEAIVSAPIEHLERVTPESRSPVISKARYAISHNRVVWSERSARALERAAEALPESSMTRDMVKIAVKIRAGLASPWR